MQGRYAVGKSKLETVKDIVLYIPRKIRNHFRTFKELQEENTKLEIEVVNRDRILKRIVATAERNSYMDKDQQLRKIKELALTQIETSSK